jgi:hypothetical protein
MQAIADRSIAGLRNELATRIDAMEKATSLWHDDLVRVPTDVQKTTEGLKNFLEQHIRAMLAIQQSDLGREIEHVRGSTEKLDEVSEERFKSIQIQFTLLKQATEQLDIANKTAIAAALQAQKEQAAETQKTTLAATAKSETSTAEAIKALTTTFNTVILGLETRITDLKGRLDRNEGRSGMADPEAASTSRELMMLRLSNAGGSGEKRGADAYGAWIIAVASLAFSLIIGIGGIVAAALHVAH